MHTYRPTYLHTYILTYITLHYIALHCITFHYITYHYITLHCITLHYITIHYNTYIRTYVQTDGRTDERTDRQTYIHNMGIKIQDHEAFFFVWRPGAVQLLLQSLAGRHLRKLQDNCLLRVNHGNPEISWWGKVARNSFAIAFISAWMPQISR